MKKHYIIPNSIVVDLGPFCIGITGSNAEEEIESLAREHDDFVETEW